MFCGALYFNGNKSGVHESAVKLANRACRYSHQQIEHLYHDESFALFNISRTGAEHDVLYHDAPGSLKSWYTDITGSHIPRQQEILDSLSVYKWDLPFSERGQWLALNWDKKKSSLKIATDFFGSVWLYIARTDKGYLFAQDFGALSGHADFCAQINEENLLVELGLGYIPDDETIYKNISMVPPGSVIQLSEQGIKIIARDMPVYDGKFANISDEDKFTFLDRHYEEIYENSIANFMNETCISLSAGLDSRYALALLQTHNQTCPAFTFGVENSDEVYGAAQVAALANISPTYFDSDETSWTDWRNSIEQLGNIGMIQWVGWSEEWLRLLSAHHQYVLIGYFGDALSGKHLIRNMPEEDWQTNWLDWSLDAWATSGFLHKDYQADIKNHIGTRLSKIAESIDTVFPHQLAMHFDIYGRQRRWTASQPNLISKFIRPKTYFLNKQLVAFWTNLPYQDLQGQRLYKTYAQSRFPRFFDKNEGRITLASRVRRKVGNQLRDLLTGEQVRRVSHVVERDRVIAQNLSHIKGLMDQSEQKLGHIMDYDKLYGLVKKLEQTETLSQRDAGLILRAVNLMILMDPR